MLRSWSSTRSQGRRWRGAGAGGARGPPGAAARCCLDELMERSRADGALDKLSPTVTQASNQIENN
jgi:hypothetical protein